MRAVVDTNSLLAGLLLSPTCEKILTALSEKRFTLVISEDLIAEFKSVASRPKFETLLTRSLIGRTVNLIRANAEIITPDRTITICRDPKDNIILDCAASAQDLDCIVSGDEDVLALTPFEDIPVIKPGEFIKRLKG